MTAVLRLRDIDADEYRGASALRLARQVAAGVLSPVALAELALDLAAAAQPALNAYVFLRRDKALREAAELEAEVRRGIIRSPLHGVPIAVKDNMYLAGEPTYKGSLTTTDEAAAVSSPMVGRMLAGGTFVIGKTTTPEFGWKATGISPRTGVTRNPWDPDRNSGGSSAGSAVTVAAGAVPIALGSDAGGSIRIPASFCGVVGLKPTLGAIPVWPGTVNETLSHAGPLTRSVADARAVLELTRGADPRDPQSAFPGALRDEPGRRLRACVVRAPFGIEPAAGVSDVLDAAYAALRSAGIAEFAVAEPAGAGLADAGLADAVLSMPPPRQIFEAMWVTGRGLGFASLIRAHQEIMDPGLARLLPLAEEYSLADFYAAVDARRAFNAELFALFSRFDVLVLPTMPLTAFAADAEIPAGGEAEAKLPWLTWTPYTYAFNISGQPAVTIPCGLTASSLPVGLQIVGPWGHDQRVLDFAQACEAVLAKHAPPMPGPGLPGPGLPGPGLPAS